MATKRERGFVAFVRAAFDGGSVSSTVRKLKELLGKGGEEAGEKLGEGLDKGTEDEAPKGLDLLDLLADVGAGGFPAVWFDRRTGHPKTWRHFVYMLRHVQRAAARYQLRTAAAAAYPQMKEEDAKRWWSAAECGAGW